jgi:stress-induced morphogen
MNIEEIKNLLRDISQFEILDIIDNSESHSKHQGVKHSSSSLTHIEVIVLNHSNLRKLDIHRNIYQKLNTKIRDGLHSIEIKILDA